jgi:DNA-binding MarR family transcriptional regulator
MNEKRSIYSMKDIKQQIWDDWYRAQGITTRFINTQVKKKAHITLEKFQVLCTMEEMGQTANATEMAKKLIKNTNTLTTILDRMEQKGFVKKARDTEDRRIVYATMTDKGKKKLIDGRKASQAAIEKLISTFSPQELRTFDGLVKRLIEAANKNIKGK